MVWVYNIVLICLTAYLCIKYSFWWLLLLLFMGSEHSEHRQTEIKNKGNENYCSNCGAKTNGDEDNG